MTKLFAGSLFSVVLAAAAAAPVNAQTSAPSPSAREHVHPGPGMRHGPQGPHEDRPFSRPTERVEAQLAFIKTALKIAPGQEPQWDAFANLRRRAAGEHEKQMQEWRARMSQRVEQRERQRPTAIERIERAQQFHSMAIKRLNEQLEVQKPLYAVLTPEQKKVADELLAPRGPGGMSGHRMGRGMAHRPA